MARYTTSREERKWQIEELLEQNMSIEEIADTLGLTESTIRGYITTFRFRKKFPDIRAKKDTVSGHIFTGEERKLQIEELLKQNMSVKEIADTLGLAENTIRDYITIFRFRKKFPHINSAFDTGSVKTANTLIDKSDSLFTDSYLEHLFEEAKESGFQTHNVNYLLRLYTKDKRFEEAINLLYHYEKNHELSEDEKAQIADLKHNLRIHLYKNLTGVMPHGLSTKTADSNIGER